MPSERRTVFARLSPYPNVQINGGWRHFSTTGHDAVRVGISVAVPVLDQNQGNILSAQENVAKVKAERELNRNTLTVFAGRACDSLQSNN